MTEYIERFLKSQEAIATALGRIADAQVSWVAARQPAGVAQTAPEGAAPTTTGVDPSQAPEAPQGPSDASERLALVARAGELGMEVLPRVRSRTLRQMIKDAEARRLGLEVQPADLPATVHEVDRPATTPVVADAPVTTHVPPAEVTDDQIRSAMIALSRAKGVDLVVKLLQEVGGAKTVSQVPQEKRQSLVQALEEAGK